MRLIPVSMVCLKCTLGTAQALNTTTLFLFLQANSQASGESLVGKVPHPHCCRPYLPLAKGSQVPYLFPL